MTCHPPLCSVMFLVAVALCHATSGVAGGRPYPVNIWTHDDGDVAAPRMTHGFDAALQQRPSELGCSEVEDYVANVVKHWTAMPHDLENVCVSLSNLIQNGTPKCSEFQIPSSIKKLYTVCSAITNKGRMTCNDPDCGK